MPTPVLRLAGTQTATTYVFYATDGHMGWAHCTVCDATGELSINSDWGQWQYRWSPDPQNLGHPTLTAFIGTRGDVDYIARKLQREGRGCSSFSSVKTAAALCSVLCDTRLSDGRSPGWDVRRRPLLTRDVARELWSDIEEVGNSCGESAALFYERVLNLDGFTTYVTDEPWEYEVNEQTPQDKALRDIVLPALIAACRATIA